MAQRLSHIILTLASYISMALPLPLEVRTNDLNDANSHWVGIWSAMPQLVESYNLPLAPFVRGCHPQTQNGV